MKRPLPLALAWVLAALLAGGCGSAGSGQGGFDARRAFDDLRRQVAIGPRPAGSPGARREARLIARELRRAGARGVRVQRPYRNVVARIPGRLPGNVVVGAHYDTKAIPGFTGANDGASGVAVLLELVRDLAPRVDGASLRLAFFDAEESAGPGDSAAAFRRTGDRGSRQYVRYARGGGKQGAAPLASIRAMVLFDMVGDCELRIPREASSSPWLYSLFARAGGGRGPFGGEAPAVLDDHTPFERAGVPAVDLIDFDYGPGPPPGAWWHTPRDDLEHVCARSLEQVGEPALAVLADFRPPGP